MQWEEIDAKLGIVKLIFGGNNQYFVKSFLDLDDNICLENLWGGYVEGQQGEVELS